MPRQVHDTFVAAWLERVAAGRSQPQLVGLLELALNTIYTSARQMLGEVTLGAIIDRVLYNAAERHVFLADLTFQASAFSCTKLLERTPPPDVTATRDGVRFVIAEVLTVLGNLTAEVITPALHAQLSTLEAKDKRS